MGFSAAGLYASVVLFQASVPVPTAELLIRGFVPSLLNHCEFSIGAFRPFV